MKEELAVIDAQVELVVRRAPEVVLEEARKAATALTDVIKSKAHKVMFNGEQYLEFEDWQTVGRFYGITAKVVSVEFVKYGDVSGFLARAVAIRSDGFELSAAEAECLNDEEKWRSKTKYEWKTVNGERQRIKVGEEPVPLFQLKSMAQTRACAKAYRNVLAWVVVLAGYRATPAEELPTETSPQQPAKPGPVVEGEVVAQSAPPASDARPGVTTVKSVGVKTGTNKRGPWTRYDVAFADGRRGGTFSDTLGAEAQKVQAAGGLCNPDLENTEKGSDLNGWLPLAPPAAAAPPSLDEPVDGPEKVLTVRKVTRTDSTVYYVIQTAKRVLYTAVEAHATTALAARKDGLGVVPSFTLGPWPPVEHPVNKLTALVAEVKAPPAAREPGADDVEEGIE